MLRQCSPIENPFRSGFSYKLCKVRIMKFNFILITFCRYFFIKRQIVKELNPFSTKVPFLYPPKTSENRRFSVFREVEKWNNG